MRRTLYYPGTFFLNRWIELNIANNGVFLIDHPEATVEKHLQNFNLLLLVFDDVQIPLDNLLFTAFPDDSTAAYLLVHSRRFRQLCESTIEGRPLIFTNEHGSLCLDDSFELYSERLAKSNWHLSNRPKLFRKDVRFISSLRSAPHEQSDRLIKRTDWRITALQRYWGVNSEAIPKLRSLYQKSIEINEGNSISAEFFGQTLLNQSLGNVIKPELLHILIKEFNTDFFDTFALPSEGFYSYICYPSVLENSVDPMSLIRSHIYNPEYLRGYFSSILGPKKVAQIERADAEVIVRIRQLDGWREFRDFFHNGHVLSLQERFILADSDSGRPKWQRRIDAPSLLALSKGNRSNLGDVSINIGAFGIPGKSFPKLYGGFISGKEIKYMLTYGLAADYFLTRLRHMQFAL